MRRRLVVSAPRGEISPSYPRRRTMAGRAELREAHLGVDERRLGLVEAILLEQRTAEHELCVPHLVDVVHASVEEAKRLPRLLLGLHRVPGAEVDLGEGRSGTPGVAVAARLERDRKRLLEKVDRVVRPAEEKVEAAE